MPTNLQEALSLSSVVELFKIKYLKYYAETFNTANPFWSQVATTSDFTGKYLEFPVPTSYQGSVGSNVIPEHRAADYGDVQITARKIYATSRIDRESMMAAMSDEGAFVRLIAEAIKKTIQADVWNHSRMAFGGLGTGALGTIDSVIDNGGGSYTLTITAATWKEANWEETMLVNIQTGNTDLFVITAVAPSTRQVTVLRQAGGTQVPAGTMVVFMQGSENGDIFGLGGVCTATSSTLYNVTVGRRWQSFQILNYGAAVTPQLLNRLYLGLEKQCGKAPTMGVTSYKQFEKILNNTENDKRYTITTMQPKGMKVSNGFQGVQFMTGAGPIKIFPDKFCEDDRLYFLNTDFIKYYRRPNTGWVKEDIGGNGYLRVVDEDQFEARHATYGQLFIAPPFQAVVTGLTTTP